MKTLLLLLLMTSVGWADENCMESNTPNCEKGIAFCNMGVWQCYHPPHSIYPDEVTVRLDKIESQLSDANKAINLLVKEDKLLQKQIEQLDYRVDVITESKQRP